MRLHAHHVLFTGALILLGGCSGGGNGSSGGTTPAGTAPLPTITFTSSAASVAASAPVTLSWSSGNATACVASGGWDGVKSVSGSESVTVVTVGANSYTLTCTGAGGSTGRSLTVTGTGDAPPAPAPTIEFSSMAASMLVNDAATLVWSSTNATSCIASGDWSDTKAVSASEAVPVVREGGNSYTLTCTGSGGSVAATVNVAGYVLANRCVALKSVARNAYAVRLDDGGYRVSASAVSGAEPLFLKPTAPGKFLMYADTPDFVAVGDGAVVSAAAASDDADWTFDTDLSGHLTIVNETAGQALVTEAGTGNLALADPGTAGAAEKFAITPVMDCAAFPEADLNVTGQTFKGAGIDQPALGFAEVHQHVSATTFLGGGHYGRPFHRFGVTEALGDCSSVHGEGGRRDLINNFYTNQPTSEHETVGWPTFVDWPHRNSLMHEGTYYRWLERAWMAGLRILVNDLVENEVLCNLQKENAEDPSMNCNEMDSAETQVGFMRAMEEYVDAQHGGAGKGWFRIVTSPAQARQVINEGKLAVVLGIEISHLFNCKVTVAPGGASESYESANPVTGESYACTQDEIDQELERLYNLGVRQMFPIHEFDNAFGGNGIFNGFVLNQGNKIDTGRYWSTYDCPEGGEGPNYFFNAGAIMKADPAQPEGCWFGEPQPRGGDAMCYPVDVRQCNARWITPTGEYAIRKMMEKKIIVEIDHLELAMKDQVMDIADSMTPDYPVVSTHGGHGGISNPQVQRIYALGGLVYDSMHKGAEFVSTLGKLRTVRAAGATQVVPMGYGADTNGLAKQSGPPDAEDAITYPFTLFSGPGWGSRFANVAPITVGKQVSGERTFDYNAEGMAHYGLIPDWVEDVRKQGGEQAIDALYSSAEEYLQMWERTCNRAGVGCE